MHSRFSLGFRTEDFHIVALAILLILTLITNNQSEIIELIARIA